MYYILWFVSGFSDRNETTEMKQLKLIPVWSSVRFQKTAVAFVE